jgi:hypothetical protein
MARISDLRLKRHPCDGILSLMLHWDWPVDNGPFPYATTPYPNACHFILGAGIFTVSPAFPRWCDTTTAHDLACIVDGKCAA